MCLPLKHNFKSKIYLFITSPPHLHHPTVTLLVSANYTNGVIGQIKTFCVEVRNLKVNMGLPYPSPTVSESSNNVKQIFEKTLKSILLALYFCFCSCISVM